LPFVAVHKSPGKTVAAGIVGIVIATTARAPFTELAGTGIRATDAAVAAARAAAGTVKFEEIDPPTCALADIEPKRAMISKVVFIKNL
jgi:hypothetical protein